MPIYVYKCKKCGKEKEILLPINDLQDTIIECENCKEKMDKLISNPSMIKYKGDGFYSTEYSKERYKEGGNKIRNRVKKALNKK